MSRKDWLVAALVGVIAFIVLEVAAYYVLSDFIISSTPAEEAEAGSIVRNWNKVMYFILGYMTIMVTALLTTSAQVPRRFKKHVLFWFYLSLPALLIMLVMAFN